MFLIKENRTKTKRSIGITLIGGFLIPVFLIVVLGMVSYTKASGTIMEKYRESSLNTVSAMSLYGSSIADGIASRAREQIANSDMKNYYEKTILTLSAIFIPYRKPVPKSIPLDVI